MAAEYTPVDAWHTIRVAMEGQELLGFQEGNDLVKHDALREAARHLTDNANGKHTTMLLDFAINVGWLRDLTESEIRRFGRGFLNHGLVKVNSSFHKATFNEKGYMTRD